MVILTRLHLLGVAAVDGIFSGVENALTTPFPRTFSDFVAYDVLGTWLVGKPSFTYVFGGKTFHTTRMDLNARSAFPIWRVRGTYALQDRGFEPLVLDMSEFRKMDGGLSCLSLRS
jgi:hypothetical protein